jgi:uncharacterized membrane protein YhaH (DUF805 family)
VRLFQLSREKMNFTGAVVSTLASFRDFRGTTARTEYWFFALFVFLLQLVLGVFDSMIGKALSVNFSWLEVCASVLLLLPQLSISARRFHDSGKSAHWLWLNLLPVIAFIFALPEVITFIQLTSMPSDAQMVSVATAVGPMFLSMMAVGLITLVFSLLPTKTYAQGNRFARPAEGDVPLGELKRQGW